MGPCTRTASIRGISEPRNFSRNLDKAAYPPHQQSLSGIYHCMISGLNQGLLSGSYRWLDEQLHQGLISDPY